MPERVPFINRENELALIDKLVGEWGTLRILCIEAPGGIGKTRLLQKVYDQYRSPGQTGLNITDIIDFDDRAYHTVESLEIIVAQMLDREIFAPFLQNMKDFRRMEKAGVSYERLKKEFIEGTDLFITCFNNLSDQKRVVILFDTIEKIEETEYQRYLIESLGELENCLICMSGRTARSIGESLQAKLGEDIIRIIDLPPLEEKAGREYLQKKQELLHIELESELIEKLLLLSGGRPILIDLAVEWRTRGISIDWLTENSLKELKTLLSDEIEKRQQDFEKQLVVHIAQTRSPMDWLILLMSRVYPLDKEMMVLLPEMPKEQVERLFDEAKTYVFVKVLPDGRITLHDEMRRMVNNYVWPELDPESYLRRRDSEFVLTYLERKIQTLVKRIDQLEEEEELVAKKGETEAVLKAFVEREALDREKEILKAEYLKHMLVIDVGKGINTFADFFEEATQAYRYAFRKTLLDQLQGYNQQLSSEQQYEVDIRKAKYLLDDGQYSEARELLIRMSTTPEELQPEQHVDILIQRANVEIRLGELQEGVTIFQEAVEISENYNLKEWLARSETGLGWAYRLTSRLQEAGQHYETALDLAIEVNSKRQQAMLYVNLGFVYAYYAHIPGHREQALWFCNQALSLWEEVEDARGIGRTYSTLGCIAFMNGQFDVALSYFQKALDIFEPADDREWLSTVYSWRGAVYISKGQLALAEKDLHKSLDQGVRKDRLMSLSRLGRGVYLYQGKLEKAQQYIEECHKLALDPELPDVLYQLVSLRDMTVLARFKREYSRLEEFEGLLDDFRKKWGEPEDGRALGMLYLNFGCLALGTSNMDKTLEYFKRGLQLVAQQGRYGNDTPQTHIERLQKFMVEELQLSIEQIRDIGEKLLSFWQEEGLSGKHPDIRILLSRWAKWEGGEI